MLSKPSWRTRLCLAALAAVGVAVAHTLAFRVALPDAHVRHGELEATGHGYWPYFVALALAFVVAGLAGFAGAQDRALPRLRRYPAIVGRLALVQIVGFILLEVVERLAVGGIELLLQEPAFLIGIPLQLLIAALGAFFLVVFARTVAWLRRSTVGTCTRTDRPSLFTNVAAPVISMATGGPSWRGPPPSRN